MKTDTTRPPSTPRAPIDARGFGSPVQVMPDRPVAFGSPLPEPPPDRSRPHGDRVACDAQAPAPDLRRAKSAPPEESERGAASPKRRKTAEATPPTRALSLDDLRCDEEGPL